MQDVVWPALGALNSDDAVWLRQDDVISETCASNATLCCNFSVDQGSFRKMETQFMDKNPPVTAIVGKHSEHVAENLIV